MPPELPVPAHDGSGVAEVVPEIERIANELAATRMQLDAQKKILADLLRHVGMAATCRGPRCKQKIFLIRHNATSGKVVPYDADGSNHFGTCVDRELFQRRK